MGTEQIIKTNLIVFERAYKKNPAPQIRYAIRIYEDELRRWEAQTTK